MSANVSDADLQEWLSQGLSTKDLVAKYPAFFRSARAMHHHFQHGDENGLFEADAVRKTHGRHLLWHEGRTLRWALGNR